MDLVEELYQQHHTELVRWCAWMTGDPTLAEDLVQEGFLRAMGSEALLGELTGEQRRSWLYRTVKNAFIDHARRRAREVLVEAVAESDLESADEAALAELNGLEWGELLARLPGQEGLLFSMRYLQGYTSAELGRFFGLPPGTVRSKLSSARKHLKLMMEGNYHA